MERNGNTNNGDYNTLQSIVEQLEFCGFVTPGNNHELKNNAAFLALKKMAGPIMLNKSKPEHQGPSQYSPPVQTVFHDGNGRKVVVDRMGYEQRESKGEPVLSPTIDCGSKGVLAGDKLIEPSPVHEDIEQLVDEIQISPFEQYLLGKSSDEDVLVIRIPKKGINAFWKGDSIYGLKPVILRPLAMISDKLRIGIFK